MMSGWLAVGLVVGLGACTTALPPEKTEALGPPYNEHTKEAYLQLAAAEGDTGILSGSAYRSKARAAMLGDTVWPDKVGDRERIAPAAHNEALIVRERLIAALKGNARERVPEQAAVAVASFDCWLRDLERAQQTSGCRETLMAALERSEAAAAATDVPKRYPVLFDPGSDRLGVAALQSVREAARGIGTLDPATVEVVGFADPTGSPEINQALSLRRAEAVTDELVAQGVSAGKIEVEGRGATGTAAEPASRRVDITLAR